MQRLLFTLLAVVVVGPISWAVAAEPVLTLTVLFAIAGGIAVGAGIVAVATSATAALLCDAIRRRIRLR